LKFLLGSLHVLNNYNSNVGNEFFEEKNLHEISTTEKNYLVRQQIINSNSDLNSDNGNYNNIANNNDNEYLYEKNKNNNNIANNLKTQQDLEFENEKKKKKIEHLEHQVTKLQNFLNKKDVELEILTKKMRTILIENDCSKREAINDLKKIQSEVFFIVFLFCFKYNFCFLRYLYITSFL
jgi:uncharacterized coiled-coil protein SlyX